MAKITLKEYALRHGRSPATVRQKAYRGGFTTVEKIGRDLWIDEDEPYNDERVTSGKYRDWNRYRTGSRSRSAAEPASPTSPDPNGESD